MILHIIPAMNFFTVQGEGNPIIPQFGKYISVLYALSYGVKMSPKQGCAPDNYFEYSIYPPEGVWNLKSHPLLKKVKFETITKGDCVQMLHTGSYDDEPASFVCMEAFAEINGLKRLSKIHREIYLSDARKTVPEKLRTILRFSLN